MLEAADEIINVESKQPIVDRRCEAVPDLALKGGAGDWSESGHGG